MVAPLRRHRTFSPSPRSQRFDETPGISGAPPAAKRTHAPRRADAGDHRRASQDANRRGVAPHEGVATAAPCRAERDHDADRRDGAAVCSPNGRSARTVHRYADRLLFRDGATTALKTHSPRSRQCRSITRQPRSRQAKAIRPGKVTLRLTPAINRWLEFIADAGKRAGMVQITPTGRSASTQLQSLRYSGRNDPNNRTRPAREHIIETRKNALPSNLLRPIRCYPAHRKQGCNG